jgi:hypothetical protein
MDKKLCGLCACVVQYFLKTVMLMNKGQKPGIQPFCKSIECAGRKPIDTIHDDLEIGNVIQESTAMCG